MIVEQVLDLDLARHLLELDDDKLSRLERCETNQNVDDAKIDIILGGRLSVALDEIGLARRLAGESALAEESSA